MYIPNLKQSYSCLKCCECQRINKMLTRNHYNIPSHTKKQYHYNAESSSRKQVTLIQAIAHLFQSKK